MSPEDRSSGTGHAISFGNYLTPNAESRRRQRHAAPAGEPHVAMQWSADAEAVTTAVRIDALEYDGAIHDPLTEADLATRAIPFISAERLDLDDPPHKSSGKTRMFRATDTGGSRDISMTLVTLGLIGALTLSIAAMATRPFSKDAQTDLAAVSPVDTPPPATVSEEPQPDPVQPATALAAVVAASLEENVSRNLPADLITPAGRPSEADSVALPIKEILQGLQPDRRQAGQDATLNADAEDRDNLQIMRDHVLAGDYSVTAVAQDGQKRLRLWLPSGSVSQDEAAELIRRATERGEIVLPDALNMADGTLDADTLIFTLVQAALVADGTEEGLHAAAEMSRRAAAASDPRTRKVAGERTYVVQPGDSLTYISLQYYGEPSAYPTIFEANRQILRSPDKIQIGQRLIIPG